MSSIKRKSTSSSLCARTFILLSEEDDSNLNRKATDHQSGYLRFDLFKYIPNYPISWMANKFLVAVILALMIPQSVVLIKPLKIKMMG